MGKNTDRIVADHMVVDAIIMGARAIANMSDQDIAQDYARQSKMGKMRAASLRKLALEMLHPIADGFATRAHIDYTFPEEE